MKMKNVLPRKDTRGNGKGERVYFFPIYLRDRVGDTNRRRRTTEMIASAGV